MKIEQLREDLIKDVVSYLEENSSKMVSPSGKVSVNYIKEESPTIINNVTQIIVDSFDEYEVENNVPCSAELDYEWHNESI